MRTLWMILVALLLSAGCSKQQYGQCGAPNEDLKIMFKPKISAHPFSHSFCIVCNTEIEPSEYYDWAVSMGANETNPANPDLPCLYVYNPDAPETGIDTDTLAACKSLVCDGGGTYADMVSSSNGNFDLSPMFDDNDLVEEEWLILEEGQDMISAPQDHIHESLPSSALY